MEQTPQFITLPLTYSDKIRSMQVGQALEAPIKDRANVYNRARMAFPSAKFKTRKHENKVYLIRVA